ncbi:META domain-containing protein [Brachyspira pilosicoli]|uniref:META domain-containing protein n=1 Tax=Brachyspira pilosicoli TaxID=52584 RepID=A0A5C8EYD0_BRAPL|nr:META domain-containing protein [Brachyspira pilosicoli]TXJ41200.1 META domain-containing protein [Brachyspira pilosicoli]
MIRNNLKKRLIILSIIFLIVFSCSSTKKSLSVSTSTLTGKTYKLMNMFEDYGITISFYNTEFYGYGGANTYFGEYELRRGNILFIKNIEVTKISEEEDALTKEKEYLKYLNTASSIEFNGEELIINTLDKDIKLIFKRLY